MNHAQSALENFTKLATPIISTEKFQEMKDFIQHGNVTTYAHVLGVTKTAFLLNQKWKWEVDEKQLAYACLLHDFYGYDWHKAKVWGVPLLKMHGFTHPYTACENAIKEYGIDEEVQKAIKSHMWPLNFFDFPKSKLAWLLCISDKVCALKETLRICT